MVTQFDFDAHQVLAWLAGVRDRGITLPVQVGVPGPATAPRLLLNADLCGVGVSEAVAREYGISAADPSATVGPERFLDTLLEGYDPRVHGEVSLHFNAFAGVAATAQWIVQWIGRIGDR